MVILVLVAAVVVVGGLGFVYWAIDLIFFAPARERATRAEWAAAERWREELLGAQRAQWYEEDLARAEQAKVYADGAEKRRAAIIANIEAITGRPVNEELAKHL